MDVFRSDRIRNVVLLGHGGSGKTSLVEAMAYLSGITNRLGKVTDGNTVSDYDKEEIKRKFSITTSVVPIEWGKVKINVLDTPGYFDFVGEVEEAVAAADAAIIVVSGKAGVQVGTQKAWEMCEKYNLPRMFFVTEMDLDHVSYRKVVEDLTELYGKKIAPIHMPIRENEQFVGYVNIVKQAGRRYVERGQKKECPVPDYLEEYLEKYHDILMESVAEISEEFMERYFAGEEFSVAEVSAALKMNISDGSIIPVCMGSTVNVQGVANLLDDICGYFPSPAQKTCAGMNMKTNDIYEANYDFAKAKSAYVFKTIVDPFIGKYSLIKVCSGVIKGEDTLYNPTKDADEKPGKIYVLQGGKPIEVPELHAGDIGAIAKLNTVATANADNHHRIFWTFEGNIKTYEDKPGEMTAFNLEQEDWSLKVWSNWRESIWAIAVGFKYTKKEDMDYTRQMIFCNEYDRPASYFVDADKDKNPSAKLHTSIVTVANTAEFAITDIEDAPVGTVISLKCGSVDKGVKIEKSGKFDLISATWQPGKGDVIKLMKRADGKFIEIGRENASSDALQFAPDETDPSLLDGEVFVTGENTKATAITNFTDAEAGVVYTIYGSGSEFASTIAAGGNFVLTEAMTLSEGKFIKLAKAADGKFYEVARG